MKTFVRMALPLALLIAVPLQAQTTIGVKGGINVANVSTDDPDFEDLNESKTGFVGGAYANFGLGGVFAIQPELLYSQKGFKWKEFDVEPQFKVNYFEIPVLLKAQFPMEMIRPAVYAGPVVSFETSCKLGFAQDEISADFDCDSTEAGAADRKTTEFGAVFGANLDLFVGPVVLTVDGRYQLGLTDLNDNPDTPDESVKNKVWQFMAGVGFTL
jgi:hypothetical protein